VINRETGIHGFAMSPEEYDSLIAQADEQQWDIDHASDDQFVHMSRAEAQVAQDTWLAIKTGTVKGGLDKKGQPNEDPYRLGAQFGGIVDSSGSDSALTTAGKVWDLLVYNRPDTVERNAKREAAEAAEAAKWAEIDQMEASSIGTLFWGITDLSGGSEEAKAAALSAGGLVEAAAMTGAARYDVAPEYIGARSPRPVKEIPRFSELKWKPGLPPPEAQVRYSWKGHATAAAAEEQLARTVQSLPNQVVVRWGDRIGVQGSDVISVNILSGDVTLWDGKYRSADTRIQGSPTFSMPSRRQNAIDEAIQTLRQNKVLSIGIKQAAIRNLQLGRFETRTVGFGNAKNSVLK
jgi:hypothetical protein